MKDFTENVPRFEIISLGVLSLFQRKCVGCLLLSHFENYVVDNLLKVCEAKSIEVF